MKKSVISIISAVVGVTTGAVAMGKVKESAIKAKDQKVNKFKDYYYILNQWLELRQQGKTLEQYFINNGIKTIAIYGMGELGNHLYLELKDTSVDVKYAVDKDARSIYTDLLVVDKEETLDFVDAMVVTATYAFDKIKEDLSEKVEFTIISLEDIVYEV